MKDEKHGQKTRIKNSQQKTLGHKTQTKLEQKARMETRMKTWAKPWTKTWTNSDNVRRKLG